MKRPSVTNRSWPRCPRAAALPLNRMTGSPALGSDRSGLSRMASIVPSPSWTHSLNVREVVAPAMPVHLRCPDAALCPEVGGGLEDRHGAAPVFEVSAVVNTDTFAQRCA